MAIAVKCSSCNSKYQVRDNLAGQSITCKDCGGSIVVSGSATIPIANSAADVPATASAARGAKGKIARPVSRQKSSSESIEQVLPRVMTSSGRARSSGNQQMLWIVGGAALALLLVVVLIVSSVGPSGEPADQLGKFSPAPSIAAPPSAARPAESSQPADSSPRAVKSSSPDGSFEGKPVMLGGTPAPAPANEAAKSAGTEASKPPREKPSSSKREVAVVIDSDDWDVKIDPADEPYEIDARKKILATFPKNSTAEVVYPDTPGSCVAVGSNNNPREVREVRDVQGNRRIGAVRASAIVDARTALRCDGLFFAAWPNGRNKIGVWDIKGERPHGIISSGNSIEPRLLMFAGIERLIAIGNADELLAWSMPGGQPLRPVPLPKLEGEVIAGLSPGGRFLAIAASDPNRHFIRVFDLARGDVAGEINLEGFGGMAMACRGLAFSPDGAELAALCESPDESKLFAVGVANAKVAAAITIAGSLKKKLKARTHAGRPLEWFPNRERWFVYGRGVIDREAGELVWSMPVDAAEKVSASRVLDDNRILTLSVEKNDPAIVALTVVEDGTE